MGKNRARNFTSPSKKMADVLSRHLVGEHMVTEIDKLTLSEALATLGNAEQNGGLIAALLRKPQPFLKRQTSSKPSSANYETNQEYAARIKSMVDENLLEADLKLEAREAKRQEKARMEAEKQAEVVELPQHSEQEQAVIDELKQRMGVSASSSSSPFPSFLNIPQPIQITDTVTSLLSQLSRLVSEKFPDATHPWHQASMEIHRQAEILNDRFDINNAQGELRALQDTVSAAITAIKNPNSASLSELNTVIDHCADRSSFWLKLFGALTVLAGLVVATLTAATSLVSAGLGMAAGYSAAAALTTCGATMFYSGTQGPMAKSLSNLSSLMKEESDHPKPGA